MENQRSFLYDMKLHERRTLRVMCTNNDGEVTVMRVPGGWIYETRVSTCYHPRISTVFIPYSPQGDDLPYD